MKEKGEAQQEAGGSEAFGPVAEYYDHLMRLAPYGAWQRYIDGFCEQLGVRPRWLLDLACGTGTVAIMYARRGVRVVGADNSLPMLMMAQRKAAAQHLPVLFVLQDATALSFAPRFDLVTSLFDSLNYLIGLEKLAACFAGVAGALRPGGLLLFDVNTIRALRLNLFTQDNLQTNDWLKYTWVSHWDDQTRICRVDMGFEAHGRKFEETHYQMGYEMEEIRELLGGAGLEVLEVYDAYRTRPVHPRSTRAFFVARRR